LVRAVTAIGVFVPATAFVVPPSLEVHVAVYLVIAAPLLAGTVNATVAELFPRVTPVSVGALGTAAATNALDAADGALSPRSLLATTRHV
jgi:hypothetical protein